MNFHEFPYFLSTTTHFTRSRSHKLADTLIVDILLLTSLLFNDHVMHNDTSCHDFSESVFVPKTGWSTNNNKSRLQNSKSSFYILPTCLLCLGKIFFLLPRGDGMVFTNVAH
uniref:Uncharacterized protein n=1 Tax=Arundo donax TaxID=35708 RepID=A0A0A9A155_ARUDO